MYIYIYTHIHTYITKYINRVFGHKRGVVLINCTKMLHAPCPYPDAYFDLGRRLSMVKIKVLWTYIYIYIYMHTHNYITIARAHICILAALRVPQHRRRYIYRNIHIGGASRRRLYVYLGAARRAAPKYMYMRHVLGAPHICGCAIVI